MLSPASSGINSAEACFLYICHPSTGLRLTVSLWQPFLRRLLEMRPISSTLGFFSVVPWAASVFLRETVLLRHRVAPRFTELHRENLFSTGSLATFICGTYPITKVTLLVKWNNARGVLKFGKVTDTLLIYPAKSFGILWFLEWGVRHLSQQTQNWSLPMQNYDASCAMPKVGLF